MASLRLVEAIHPLCDVVDSLHEWLLRAWSLLEHVVAALGRLSPALAEAEPLLRLLLSLSLMLPDVELYGCFSPDASIASSSLPALPSLGKASGMSLAPVFQIMAELHKFCEGPISTPCRGFGALSTTPGA